MNTLFAFGDSFVVGDQDDFLHELPKGIRPPHNMDYNERIAYLKYNVSFVSIFAKNNNYNLQNYAERGSGNYPQLDLLMNKILNNEVAKNDLIFFGLTTFVRDRVDLALNKKFIKMYKDRGDAIFNKEFISDHSNLWKIPLIDYFYVLNSLKFINDELGIRVVCVNLFDNIKDKHPSNINYNIQIGSEHYGNTLIDILNDTWGDKTEHPYHTNLQIPKGYEKLYSRFKHPSVSGHKKIANWLQNWYEKN